MTVSSNTDATSPASSTTSTDPPSKQQQQKKLICLRHARSQGNDLLSRPGNQWGDPTFCDDPTLIDAPLTDKGMQQVQQELLPLWETNPEYHHLLSEVDLVVVSPLTRTLQTFHQGVVPALQQRGTMPRIVAHPLATERVYTASDTGRPVSALTRDFSSPWIDWSLVDKETWWYTDNNNNTDTTGSYQEWRPHGQGQWYSVPGEPLAEFTTRMKALEEWLEEQEENTILLVAHWGVIQYLTGGYSAENCEIKLLVPWEPLHRKSSPATTTTTTTTTITTTETTTTIITAATTITKAIE